MSKPVIIGAAVLLIGSWFVIDENRSLAEKLTILFILCALYVSFRYMCGASMEEIFAPLLK